jgi:membrane-associated phospholipid phosphatase
MTTTLDQPGDASMRADDERRRQNDAIAGVPLRLPAVLFAILFVGGLILRLAPGENFLDRWGFTIISARFQSGFLHAVTDLARGPVTAAVAVVAALVIVRRDRRRSLACLAGPALAVGLAELLKIIVGRRLGGSLCWPSGSAAAIAAMVTAGVLVVRGRARWAAIVVAAAIEILEVIALVAYRSHYPTDCLGGVLVGVGCVLLADAVLHRPPFQRRPAPADPADLPV